VEGWRGGGVEAWRVRGLDFIVSARPFPLCHFDRREKSYKALIFNKDFSVAPLLRNDIRGALCSSKWVLNSNTLPIERFA